MSIQTTSSRVWTNRSLLPLAIATIAAGLVFYVPVSALFLTSRGLSLADIFILESVLLVSILISEVPAGLVADKIDRRWVILNGFVLNATADLLFAFGNSFSVFAVSFFVSGLGIAMLTGVQDAYIYDALGDDADVSSVGVWGHLSALELTAGVFASVAGGVMATRDISLPAIATAVVASLAAFSVLFLPSQKPSIDKVSQSENSWSALKKGTGLLLKSPILLYTTVASGAAFVLFNAVFTLNQPLFNVLAVPVAWWGVIGGGAHLLAAAYNHFAGPTIERLGRKNGLLLAMTYGAAGFGLMVFPNKAAVIVGFVLVVLGMHARGPINRAVANKEIPSHRRATVLNIASSLGSLVGVLLNPLIGWGSELSPSATVGVIAIVLALMTTSWIPIANRYLDEQPADDEPSEQATIESSRPDDVENKKGLR